MTLKRYRAICLLAPALALALALAACISEPGPELPDGGTSIELDNGVIVDNRHGVDAGSADAGELALCSCTSQECLDAIICAEYLNGCYDFGCPGGRVGACCIDGEGF